MSDRDPFDAELRRLLRHKDRRVSPSPEFAAALMDRLSAELTGSGPTERGLTPMQSSSLPVIQPAHLRWIGALSTRRAVLSTGGLAAVLLAMVAGLYLLTASPDDRPAVAPSTTATAQPVAAASPSPVTQESTVAMVDADPGRTGVVAVDGPRDISGVRWSTDGTGVAPSAFQVVAAGSTVVQVRPAANGENDGSALNYLEGFDAATGQRLWSTPLDAAGPPAIAGGSVIVPVVARGSDGSIGAGEVSLAAFSLEAGTRSWETALPGATRAYVNPTPIVVDGVVYLSCATGQVSAVEAATGTLLWQSTEKLYTEPLDEGHPFPNQPAPVTYADGALFEVTPAGDLLALDPANGRVTWSLNITDRFGVQSAGTRLAATRSGLALVVTVAPATPALPTESHWYLINSATGASTRDGGLDGMVAGVLAVNRTLFVALRQFTAETATIVKLNLASADVGPTVTLADQVEIVGMSGAANGRIYVAFATGQAAAYSMKDLSVLSAVQTGTFLAGAPVIDGDALVVQTDNRGFVALGAARAAATTPASEPAAMGNGDPARSGELPYDGPASLTASRTLDIGIPFDGPNGPMTFGLGLYDAVAFDGTLYQSTDRPTEDQPVDGGVTSTSFLRAVDIATGDVRWELPGLTIGPPVATADSVYVAIQLDNSASPSLVALNAATGEVRWQVDLGAADANNANAPILVEGTVYVTASDGSIEAVDAASGAVRWSSDAAKPPADQPDALKMLQAPSRAGQLAYRDGQLYVVARDGAVAALSPADGALAWRFDTRAQLQTGVDPMSILAADGGVIVGANTMPVSGNHAVTKLVRLDAKSGAIAWVKTVDEFVWWLGLSDGTLIVADSSAVSAYDAATGDRIARATVDVAEGEGAAPFALAGGTLWAATADGTIATYDASSLVPSSITLETGGTLRGPLLVMSDAVVVSSDEAILVVSGG